MGGLVRNSGFSLMEMLVALSVLLIALSSMFGVFVQGAKHLAQFKTALPAYTVARAKMEEFLSWSMLDSLDGADGVVTDGEYTNSTNPLQLPLVNLTLFTKAAAQTSYRPVISIANVTDSTGLTVYDNRLKRVRVSVSWFDGKNRTFNLTTIKADY